MLDIVGSKWSERLQGDDQGLTDVTDGRHCGQNIILKVMNLRNDIGAIRKIAYFR